MYKQIGPLTAEVVEHCYMGFDFSKRGKDFLQMSPNYFQATVICKVEKTFTNKRTGKQETKTIKRHVLDKCPDRKTKIAAQGDLVRLKKKYSIK